jgi:hypothetical protein
VVESRARVVDPALGGVEAFDAHSFVASLRQVLVPEDEEIEEGRAVLLARSRVEVSVGQAQQRVAEAGRVVVERVMVEELRPRLCQRIRRRTDVPRESRAGEEAEIRHRQRLKVAEVAQSVIRQPRAPASAPATAAAARLRSALSPRPAKLFQLLVPGQTANSSPEAAKRCACSGNG